MHTLSRPDPMQKKQRYRKGDTPSAVVPLHCADRSLGLNLCDRAALIEHIRKGLPAKALENLARALDGEGSFWLMGAIPDSVRLRDGTHLLAGRDLFGTRVRRRGASARRPARASSGWSPARRRSSRRGP